MFFRPLALVALGAAVLLGCGDEDGSEAGPAAGEVDVQDASWTEGPTEPTADRLACTAADEPANFSVYWLGPRFEDLDLSAILRRCDKPYPGEPGRANSVSFIYGTCELPEGEGGCAPPLQVETAPACERSLADYGNHATPTDRLGEARGVPASLAGAWAEIYAGESTIVVHAGPDLRSRAIDALAAIPAETPPAAVTDESAAERPAELPPPVPGHLTGELSCAS